MPSLILAEQKLPALIIAHLAARRTDTDYPTPSAGNLPLIAGPVKETTKRVQPSLEVWVPSFDLKDRRDDEQFDVMLDLHASQDTALATELGWLAAIRRSFAGGPTSRGANATTSNTNPFLAYLNALSSGARADWEVKNFALTGGQILITDDRRVIYRTTAQCSFRSHVLTV